MLPEDVRRLIQTSVPTIDALEALLFLARHADRTWQANEIVNQMQPTAITESAVREYLALFQEQGLVVSQLEGSFRYQPTSPELETAIQALIQAYHEQPVSLIRAVYEIANSKKIQAFADAFKIKKE
jgi:hypothetical protein